MRKYILPAILFLGIYFGVTHFGEIQKIALTLRAGDWRYVLLAILVEVLWLWALGKTYQSIYRVLGMKEDHKHMASLAAGAYFVSVVAPTAGVSALAVFISDARRRGHSTARVTVAGAVYLLCEYLGILGAVGLGFIVLFRRRSLQLHWPELMTAALLGLATIFLLVLLFLAHRSPRIFSKVLVWLVQAGNRITRPFIRREWLPIAQVQGFAAETSTCMGLLRRSTRADLVRPFLFSFGNKIILIGILVLVFLAFGVPFSAGTIVAGFGLAYLFAIMSPTPSGVGIVEGILTLSLRSLGVPLEPAAVITLAFRGVTFWEPLIIGGYMFRHVNKVKETRLPELN